ncbi:hypothetical protein PACILC2_01020 [Paenibacillus cisolokensis]|uniref:Uncharacterized protein n=1 Tax=Paenibacillus cisolokensis TaxID=1658519 RepID=A0ABQ4N063_9BACL|nr:hypothetical protein PACILC2_01020 [Paenibacillus cisolokensis]
MLDRLGIHIEKFPQMAVNVLEAPGVHKSVIGRVAVSLPSGRKRPVDKLADLLAASKNLIRRNRHPDHLTIVLAGICVSDSHR